MTVDIASRFRTAQSGYPFYLPTLFGSGQEGNVTGSNESDIGHLNFGVRQYNNLTIPTGVTWTIGRGLSGGAAIIGVRGKLRVEGTINGSGQNGSTGIFTGSGKGGDAPGGTAGGASQTSNADGIAGTLPNKYAHGICSLAAGPNGIGAPSGAFRSSSSGTSGSPSVYFPSLDGSSTYARYQAPDSGGWRTINGVWRQPNVYVSGITGTASTGAGGGTSIAVKPTSNYGPWSSHTEPLPYLLHRDFIPAGPPGAGGGVTGVASHAAAGGGGGSGGGVLIIEADTIELVSGYSILFNGGNGGNGYSSNGTTAVAAGGSPGQGGIVYFICRTLIGSTASINVSAGSPGTGAGTSAATGWTGVAGLLRIEKV